MGRGRGRGKPPPPEDDAPPLPVGRGRGRGLASSAPASAPPSIPANPKPALEEPPAKKQHMSWPGQKEEAPKEEKREREAWEYLKKDEFGTANFFSFDSF